MPQDANLVLSQDELKLGEQLILHLRNIHSSLPDEDNADAQSKHADPDGRSDS